MAAMQLPERTADAWVSTSLVQQGVRALWLATTPQQGHGLPDIEVRADDRLMWLEMKGINDAGKIEFGNNLKQREELIEKQQWGASVYWNSRWPMFSSTWFGWAFYCLPHSSGPPSGGPWKPSDFHEYPQHAALICPCAGAQNSGNQIAGPWTIPFTLRSGTAADDGECPLERADHAGRWPRMMCHAKYAMEIRVAQLVALCSLGLIGLPIGQQLAAYGDPTRYERQTFHNDLSFAQWKTKLEDGIGSLGWNFRLLADEGVDRDVVLEAPSRLNERVDPPSPDTDDEGSGVLAVVRGT